MTLYEQLADRVGLGNSKIAPRLFQMLVDETGARILLSLPAQIADLEGKVELSPEEIEQNIQELFLKGLVFISQKTLPPTYRMCRDMVQFHDATILWKDAPRKFLDLWQEFMETEWPELALKISKTVTKPFTRVIPINVTIEAKTHILDFESVSETVKNAKNLAVTKCTCRLIARKCDHPLETCIQVNKAADYALTRGTGRKIDAREALDILRMAEEKGLVHITMNRQQIDTIICNCCPCCCQVLPILIKGGIQVVDPSRFRAEIDSDLCSGCGTCHERCHFGAISWQDDQESISFVDAVKCLGCGLCRVTCPEDAINLIETRSEDFIPL